MPNQGQHSPEAINHDPLDPNSVAILREPSGDVVFRYGSLSTHTEFARVRSDGFFEVTDKVIAAEGFRFMANHLGEPVHQQSPEEMEATLSSVLTWVSGLPHDMESRPRVIGDLEAAIASRTPSPAVDEKLVEKTWAAFVNCRDDQYFGNRTKMQKQLQVLRSFAAEVSAMGSALEAKALSYDYAHEDAVELGYPSLTEALEELERLKSRTPAVGEELVPLPNGLRFIDEDALDRWRAGCGHGHDLVANQNTVWRLVATIDYFRAALSNTGNGAMGSVLPDKLIEALRQTIVELWHDANSGHGTLHECLGMTWEEYQAWANPLRSHVSDGGVS